MVVEVDRVGGVSEVAVAEVGQKRNRKGGLKKGKGNGDCGGGGGGDYSEHDMHIWTERERRKKMRNMFSSLHALLPQLPAKVRNLCKMIIKRKGILFPYMIYVSCMNVYSKGIINFNGSICTQCLVMFSDRNPLMENSDST